MKKLLIPTLSLAAALSLTATAHADVIAGPAAVLRHAVSAVGPGGSCPGRHGVSIAEILEKEKVRCFT